MSISLFPSPGLTLPLFDSLLVKGPYPPSAPFHLCLSHLQSKSGSILLLTPSRQAFADALQEFNDSWLTTNAAKGQYLNLLSRVNTYYPPSTAHWLLLLSLFRPLSQCSASSPKLSVLPQPPSLIVLHEPSAYFFSDSESESRLPDLSHYLQLITTAFSTASFLSPHADTTIPLVLFDSRLGDLKLPIVRPVTPTRRLFTGRPEQPARQESVAKFVEKYFTWIGNVIDAYAEQTPRTPPRHGTLDLRERIGPFKLRLDRRAVLGDDPQSNVVIVEWSEIKRPGKPHSTLKETEFIFNRET